MRDPNFKTLNDADVDLKRIKAISDFKKTSADTHVRTTHFIKKAVMVPISLNKSMELIEPKNTMQPFMRGIMTFDDYNYKNLNEYVLIEEPNDFLKRKKELDSRMDDVS